MVCRSERINTRRVYTEDRWGKKKKKKEREERETEQRGEREGMIVDARGVEKIERCKGDGEVDG